jgi:hypothetical protein
VSARSLAVFEELLSFYAVSMCKNIEYFVTVKTHDGHKEILKDNHHSDFGFMRHPRGSILQAMSRHYRRS